MPRALELALLPSVARAIVVLWLVAWARLYGCPVTKAASMIQASFGLAFFCAGTDVAVLLLSLELSLLLSAVRLASRDGPPGLWRLVSIKCGLLLAFRQGECCRPGL